SYLSLFFLLPSFFLPPSFFRCTWFGYVFMCFTFWVGNGVCGVLVIPSPFVISSSIYLLNLRCTYTFQYPLMFVHILGFPVNYRFSLDRPHKLLQCVIAESDFKMILSDCTYFDLSQANIWYIILSTYLTSNIT